MHSISCGSVTNALMEAESLRLESSDACGVISMGNKQLIKKAGQRLTAAYRDFIHDYQSGIDNVDATNPPIKAFSSRLRADGRTIKGEKSRFPPKSQMAGSVATTAPGA